MEITASLHTVLDGERIFAVVNDLGTYPRWLDIVGRAVPTAADPAGDDPGPAWLIDLRGQLGPLRRSKRLRMVRSSGGSTSEVRFDRRELDGRDHSPWVLEATLKASDRPGQVIALTMRLHYGGSLWVPLLDRVLRDEIERSKPRLVTVAEELSADAG